MSCKIQDIPLGHTITNKLTKETMSYLVNVLMKPHIHINSLGMKALMGISFYSVNLPFVKIDLDLCIDFGSMQQNTT